MMAVTAHGPQSQNNKKRWTPDLALELSIYSIKKTNGWKRRVGGSDGTTQDGQRVLFICRSASTQIYSTRAALRKIFSEYSCFLAT
jgi:hypothetical protein